MYRLDGVSRMVGEIEICVKHTCRHRIPKQMTIVENDLLDGLSIELTDLNIN